MVNFDTSQEMIIRPVRDNYVSITADHDLEKRYINLLDSDFKLIKKLHEGRYDWRFGNSFQIYSYRIEVECYDKNKEIDKIKITESDKNKTINEIQQTQPEWVYDQVKTEPNFYEHYPAINHFQLTDNKIFIISNKMKENKTEIWEFHQSII